jgi:hypothetical protein
MALRAGYQFGLGRSFTEPEERAAETIQQEDDVPLTFW